jgi:ribosomal protein L17
LTHWYQAAKEWHTEPVIKNIYDKIAKDETRHGVCYVRFMEKELKRNPDKARVAILNV